MKVIINDVEGWDSLSEGEKYLIQNIINYKLQILDSERIGYVTIEKAKTDNENKLDVSIDFHYEIPIVDVKVELEI